MTQEEREGLEERIDQLETAIFYEQMKEASYRADFVAKARGEINEIKRKLEES